MADQDPRLAWVSRRVEQAVPPGGHLMAGQGPGSVLGSRKVAYVVPRRVGRARVK